MRLSDTKLAKQAAQIKAAEKAGQDVSQAKAAYLDAEIEEYRARQQRQPTELSHGFNLAMKLFMKGDIDGAAGNFQKALEIRAIKNKATSISGTASPRRSCLIWRFSNIRPAWL